MSKMADEQIINALENRFAETFDTGWTKIQHNELSNLIDLINRQQAEIEKLTINMNAFGLGMKREKERADTIRAEAIKEFADRLKEHLKGNGGLFCVTTMNAQIDNLVKEMVAEGK